MKKFFFIILLFADLTYLYADTGSRQQLLLETIRCLDTNCIDEPTIQTLTHASEVFDIPELKSYAQLRQTNTIDTCSRRMLECVDRLIAYSDHLYDSVSYQSVYLRFLRMDFTMNIEKWEQQLAEVYRLTIALFQKDSNPENQELWYFAKLLQLIGNGIACNPTKEYDIVTLLLEIDDFYKDRPRSYIKQQIYSLAGGQMQTFAMNFKGYATCLGEILKQEEKNSAIFNMAIDTIYVYDTVPVYLTTNHFIKESFHCYSELHKNCFVDIFSEEIAYIWRSELWIDNPDVLISYMKDGYNQMTAYFGERDPACTVANLCIRHTNVLLC